MKHTILQQFFKERLKELFHKDTIDSHRVRFHNTNSLLKELRTLIVDWKKNKIKQFETVCLCAQELIDSLKNDEYISMGIYNKELFLKDLETITKNDGKKFNGIHELFILDKLINENRLKYLDILFHELEKIVLKGEDFLDEDFIPKAQKIDNIISLLATELINSGYSKSYIYSCISAMNEEPDFEKGYQKLKDKFLGDDKSRFVVIFKLKITDKEFSDSEIEHIYKDVAPEYLAKNVEARNKNFLKNGDTYRFFICEENVRDYYWAIKNTKAKLSSLLDHIYLGINNLNIYIPDKALVIDLNHKNNGAMKSTNYISDGKYGSNLALFKQFRIYIAKIDQNMNIKQDVKDRLNSALRYLRLGNTTIEMEQRFINYWIALEFLFSSPETDEITFTRLKTNLVNILYCSYAKRNILLLNTELVTKGIINTTDCFWKFEMEEIDRLIDRIDEPLLRYRIQMMKAKMLGKSDKRKSYLKNHETNLNHHIARIYRLRNELIHEAAIKQDIENITSNLRYYLVFLLNQMIVYFANIPNERENVDMDDLFNEYLLRKKQIQHNHEVETILDIPLEMDLIV